MSHAVTEHLEPQAFFHWFEELSKIPHGSGKEQKLGAFLLDFARQREIPAETDDLGNIFMRLPATAGYEAEPTVLFQAHMDMIWAKAPGVDFDFETQPLRLAIQGDKLHAQGTTLGADNAVGMATMLALADGTDIPHPPLEFLFTVQEETGMRGIRGFSMDRITARRMINMDCGDSHVLAVSSLGRISSKMEKQYPVTPVPQGWQVLELTLGGGTGGHSGLNIHKGRCCAANAMGVLLSALDPMPLRLIRLEAHNPIFKSCQVLAALPENLVTQAKLCLQEGFDRLREKHRQTDPELYFTVEPAVCTDAAIGPRDTADLLRVLAAFETKRYLGDPRGPDITVLSGAMIGVCLEKGAFRMDYNFRSTQDEKMQELAAHHGKIARERGLELQCPDRYTGWPERQQSRFREKFLRIHERLFGASMALERVSGGIEVGIIMAAIPDMDPVGIAPTARGAHTPEEHLFISQVEDYWKLLRAVLAEVDR